MNPSGDPTKGTDVTALKNTAGKIVGYLANDPSARYIRAGLGSFGNTGRNTLQTNHINNFDMSVMKKISATERFKVEFGAGAYNVFNHAQFVPGQLNNINLTSFTTSRNFLIPGTRDFNNFASVYSSNPRTVTLIGRFTF